MLGASMPGAGVSIAAAELVREAKTHSEARTNSRTRIFILFQQAPVLISHTAGSPLHAFQSVNREKSIGRHFHSWPQKALRTALSQRYLMIFHRCPAAVLRHVFCFHLSAAFRHSFAALEGPM